MYSKHVFLEACFVYCKYWKFGPPQRPKNHSRAKYTPEMKMELPCCIFLTNAALKLWFGRLQNIKCSLFGLNFEFWMVAMFRMVFISAQSPPNAPWIASLFGQYLTSTAPPPNFPAPPPVRSIQTKKGQTLTPISTDWQLEQN